MALVEEVDENFDARAISERRRKRVSSIPHFSIFKGKNETKLPALNSNKFLLNHQQDTKTT